MVEPHRQAAAGVVDVDLAARRPVEDGVSKEDGVARVVSRGAHDDAAAAHPLADVVVGLARERELDPSGEEGAEALAGRPLEARAHASRRRLRSERAPDRASEARPDGAVAVADPVAELDDPRLLERGRSVRGQTGAELPSARVRSRLPGVGSRAVPRTAEQSGHVEEVRARVARPARTEKLGSLDLLLASA